MKSTMGEVTEGLGHASRPPEQGLQDLAGQEMASDHAPTAISLEDLRRAFENAMDLPRSEPGSTQELAIGAGTESEGNSPREAVPTTPASIVEAILFVGSPAQSQVSISVLMEILQGMTPADIESTILELNESYRKCAHPWHIVRDGDTFSMQLLESSESILERLQGTPRDTALSQTSIDCLSLIAYRPGITKEDLESFWRQSAGSTLSNLIKRGLVRVEGETDPSGLRYFTTDRVLEILGLRSLEDLPQGDEL